MSNRYKGYNPPVADHRNEGFTPKQAMYEHNQEKTVQIDKSIITKPGLPMYSDKQVADMSGAVTVTSLIPERITWDKFKSLKYEQQVEYLDKLFARYPSVMLSLVADMFGVDGRALNAYLKRYGEKYYSKNRPDRNPLDQKNFRKEMLKGILPLGDKPKAVVKEPKQASLPENKPTALKTPRIVKGGIVGATIRCNAEDLPDMMAQLGMVGMVDVIIMPAKEERKENEDGLK